MENLTLKRYEQQKQSAIENQSSYSGTLKELRLINQKECLLKGNKVELSNTALKQLLALLGLKAVDATFRRYARRELGSYWTSSVQFWVTLMNLLLSFLLSLIIKSFEGFREVVALRLAMRHFLACRAGN